jgi:hypothetical protein
MVVPALRGLGIGIASAPGVDTPGCSNFALTGRARRLRHGRARTLVACPASFRVRPSTFARIVARPEASYQSVSRECLNLEGPGSGVGIDQISTVGLQPRTTSSMPGGPLYDPKAGGQPLTHILVPLGTRLSRQAVRPARAQFEQPGVSTPGIDVLRPPSPEGPAELIGSGAVLRSCRAALSALRGSGQRWPGFPGLTPRAVQIPPLQGESRSVLVSGPTRADKMCIRGWAGGGARAARRLRPPALPDRSSP